MISEILIQKYGIACRRITPTKGGWMANAYRVDAEQGTYFLKVYSKKRVLSAYYTRNIEVYSRVMAELAQNCGFAEYTAIPIAGMDGSYRVETEDSILWLFPWIDGTTVAEAPLNDADTVRLAELLETMHAAVGTINFPRNFPAENFRNLNAVKLRNALTEGTGRAEIILKPYAGIAEKALDRVNRAEEEYRSASFPLVLVPYGHPFVESDAEEQ